MSENGGVIPLKDKETSQIASIATGVVGAVIGGYPGMQIGMALGWFLFQPEEKKGTDYRNDDMAISRSAINVVPEVVGTDMVAGKIVWWDKSVFGTYNLKDIPHMEGDDEWEAFVNSVGQFPGILNVKFIASFCDRYTDSYHVNNRIYLNSKDQWLWCFLSDIFRLQAVSLLAPPPFATQITNNYVYWKFPSGIPEIPFKQHQLMKFEGLLGDFTALSADPEVAKKGSSMIIADFTELPKLYGRINEMPTITAEISRTMFHGWSFPKIDPLIDGVVHHYRDSWKGDYSYSVPGAGYWSGWFGCKDAKNDYFYGFEHYDASYPHDVINKLHYLNSYTNVYEKCTNGEGGQETQNWLDDITLGRSANMHPAIARTDLINDRIYFFHGRNWYNGTKYANHHANYSLKFDMFYVDRQTQIVNSFIYDETINIEGLDGGYPSLTIASMEIDADYIYLFGNIVQSEFVFSDTLLLNTDTSTATRIYADFSAYPDGFWEGYYASISSDGAYFKCWREITVQTSTYIEVSEPFGQNAPEEGITLKIQKYQTDYAEWGIVGEGSTSSNLIINVPAYWAYTDPPSQEFTHCWYPGDFQYGAREIDTISGTTVDLVTPLPREPYPGEKIMFGYINVTFDEDIVNPIFLENNDLLVDHGVPYFDAINTRLNSYKDNEFKIGEYCILKINRSTKVVDIVRRELTDPNSYYGWGSGIMWTGPLYPVWQTCATDKEIFFYVGRKEAGGGPNNRSWWGIISLDTATINSDEENRYNQYYSGGTPGNCYFGTVPVEEYDSVLEDFKTFWYTILIVWDTAPEFDNVVPYGIYFLKLTEGKFSNKYEAYDWDTDFYNPYRGLRIDRDGIQIILYRPGVASGPAYWNIGTSLESSSKENYFIGKYDYNQSIYFSVIRAYETLFPDTWSSEVWKYIPPTPTTPNGELICINQQTELWSETYRLNTLSSSKYLIHNNSNFIQSNYNDENPVNIIWIFLNELWGPKYDNPGVYMDYTSWREACNICFELVNDTVYYEGREIQIFEPRFLFSLTYDRERKLFDIISEIMATTMGFCFICGGYWRFKVPTQDETPEYYFGNVKQYFNVNGSGSKTRIYADFSAYPDGFWIGDLVHCDDFVFSFYPDRDWGLIIDQTSYYIDIEYGSDNILGIGIQFEIKKDNIKEGTFTFARKSSKEKANKIRIEFKNRLCGYIKDIAEAEDTYALDILGEEEKIKTYKMPGIKRATQAGRLALRILDYERYVWWLCGFETDIIGVTLCLGDIIGVSHDTTGWSGKYFRVVEMEELMDYEVRLSLEEYNPYIYHDKGVIVYQGSGYSGFPQPTIPIAVERFRVFEDIEFNRLYFSFKSPNNDPYFVGAKIYVKVGTEWVYQHIQIGTTSSVILAQDVGINDTTIYYDPDSVFGTFPTSGVLWIENELVYYFGLDTVNYAFTNVIRGYKDTDQVAHDTSFGDIYIVLKENGLNYYEYPDSWVGTTQQFKASSMNIFGMSNPYTTTGTFSIDIIGYGVLPYFPESIQNKLPEYEYFSEFLGLGDENIDFLTAYITETLGLGDQATVSEFLLAISEDMGLGDETIDFLTAYITETLGLGDSNTITEMLLAISESLGLNDDLEDVS